jgi:phosphatidylglycerophosphate synthase
MKLVVNLLTLSRVLFAGGAAFFLQSSMQWNYQWFAVLIVLAGITDAIDGPIARKCNVATKGGGRLDHGVDAVFLGVLLAGMFSLTDKNICIALVMLQFLTVVIAIVQVLSKAEEVWPNEEGKISIICLVLAVLCGGSFKETGFDSASSWWAGVFAMIAILARLLSLWKYWRWLEQYNFLWREESKGGKQVGKDPE